MLHSIFRGLGLETRTMMGDEAPIERGAINVQIGATGDASPQEEVERSEQSFVPKPESEAALRSGMVVKVVEILNSRRRNLTDYHIEELYKAAKYIEEHLFATASTEENYLDEGSLPFRIDSILEQQQNEPQLPQVQVREEGQPAAFTQRVRDAQEKMRMASPASQKQKQKFAPVDFDTHSVERNRVLESIVEILQTHRPNGTVNWHTTLPHLHRRLEEFLYRQHCTDMQKYSDLNTLTERISEIITLGGQKKPFQVRTLKSVPLPEHMLQPSRAGAKAGTISTAPPKKPRGRPPGSTSPTTPTTPTPAPVPPTAKGTDVSAPSQASSTIQRSEGGSAGTARRAKTKSSTDELLRKQQQRLLLLQHAAQCTAPLGECPVTPLCADMRALWTHITACQVLKCPTPHCISSRYVLSHFCNCVDPACHMCLPVRENRSLDALSSGAEDSASAADTPTERARAGPSGSVGAKRKALGEKVGAEVVDENVRDRALARRRLSGDSERSGKTLGSAGTAGTAGTAASGQSHTSSYSARIASKHITALFSPVISQLLEVPYAQAYFGAPVDPVASGAPNYFEVIKRPMDLGTVQRRLSTCSYTQVQPLIDDVEQVFENARVYNRPGTVVFNLAKRLRSIFSWATRKPRMELSQRLAELESGGSSSVGSGGGVGGGGSGAAAKVPTAKPVDGHGNDASTDATASETEGAGQASSATAGHQEGASREPAAAMAGAADFQTVL